MLQAEDELGVMEERSSLAEMGIRPRKLKSEGIRRTKISEMVGEKSKSEWETVMTEALTLSLRLGILHQEIRKL